MNAAVVLLVAWMHAGQVHVDHAPMPSMKACEQAYDDFLRRRVERLLPEPQQPRWAICVTFQAQGTNA